MLDLLIRGMVLEMLHQKVPLDVAQRKFRKAYILAAVGECAGNQMCAAHRLKVHRNTVNRVVAEFREGEWNKRRR